MNPVLWEDTRGPESALPWTPSDQELEQRVLEILAAHYPGWGWRCEAMGKGGILTIRNENLASRHGFVVHLRDIANVSDMQKRIVEGGGEFLERFDMPRGRFDPDRYMAFLVKFNVQAGPPPGALG